MHATFLAEYVVTQLPHWLVNPYCGVVGLLLTFFGAEFICWTLCHTINIYMSLTLEEPNSVPTYFTLVCHIISFVLCLALALIRAFTMGNGISKYDGCTSNNYLVYIYVFPCTLLGFCILFWFASLYKTCRYVDRPVIRFIFIQNLSGNFIIFVSLAAEIISHNPNIQDEPRALWGLFGFGSLGFVVFVNYCLTPFNLRMLKRCRKDICINNWKPQLLSTFTNDFLVDSQYNGSEGSNGFIDDTQ